MVNHAHITDAQADREDFIFTSESVSEGHPDKVCDQISDAIVDAYLSREPEARTAVEVLATTNKVVIAGEIKAEEMLGQDQIEAITRKVVKRIGYRQKGFHWQTMEVENLLHGQSPDIAQGVDADDTSNKDEGAGDQGIMFGYACTDTEALMPAAIHYSHAILKKLSEVRHNGETRLGPDAKSQVSLHYHDGKPVGTEAVLVSTQHQDGLSQDEVRDVVRPCVEAVLPDGWMCGENRFLINPTGKFVIGGPDGDAGLTGRKIIVDTYGGAAPHGGGAFSGKDPTKVDRSAAYIARYLAKNVVAAGIADRCLIQLAYAIGVAKPVAFYINTFGSDRADPQKLSERLHELVNLTPRGIRLHLQLNRPIYERSAAYGHFGRRPDDEGGFSWEKTDLADELKDLL